MADRIYTQADLAYIKSRANEINAFSNAFGVSNTAVAAAIAKENSRYNQNKFANDAQDWYATNSLTTHYAVTSASTAAIQAGWADKPVGIGNLIANASVIDMGISNIKVATAVKLLDDYYVKYPSDPLNLNEFKGNYQNVVTRLSESTGNDLTVKLSVLMIKEAQDFYTTPKVNAQGQTLNVSANDWAMMRPEEKDGLMVMYFTRGEKSMTEARAANVAANGFFNPRLGDGESGGLWTVQNALPIGEAIGQADYGQQPINGLTIEADTTPIFVAPPKYVFQEQQGLAGPLVIYSLETVNLANSGASAGYSISSITNNATGAATYQLKDATGNPIASGTNYSVAQNNTIALDSGTSKQIYDLKTGRMVAQIEANGAGFIVGGDGNDIFYGAGQLSHDSNSGAVSGTIAGQTSLFFDTTYRTTYAVDALGKLSLTRVATNGIDAVTSLDTNADGVVDDILLDLVGLNGTKDGAEIDLLTPTATTSAPVLTSDVLGKTFENFRSGLAIEDEYLVNATELRILTGAQGNGETWGGGRILEISQSALADWYNSSSSDYAGQIASGTVDNMTLDSGLNGWALNYDALNSDVYDGLGILAGWNGGETTSFASYGSGGTSETAPLFDPAFDFFVDLPVPFDPYVAPNVPTGSEFTYVAPPPSVAPFDFGGIDYYPYNRSFYQPYDWFAPVVFDLDGDGVELIDQQDSHAYYDVKGDGLGNRYNVGWVGADDGMLAIDKNADGLINQADELSFAMWTAAPNDTDMDGLKAVFDTNHNGLLDSGDARFADMRIWRDFNGDGVSDAGELQTLATAGVASNPPKLRISAISVKNKSRKHLTYRK